MEILKTLDDNKAGIALFFSLASFFFSARTAWLDRARISIKARPYVYDRGDGKLYNNLEIIVYNHGRRDAAIDKVEYKYTEGAAVYRDNNGQPFILKENQKKVFELDYSDLVFCGPEGEVFELEDIVLIDLKGRELTFPNSKEHIKKLFDTFTSK